MSDELKPCPTPWCAHPRPTICRTEWWQHYIKCYGCDVRGPEERSQHGAARRWNHRPVEDELRAEVERLRYRVATLERHVARASTALGADDLEEPVHELAERRMRALTRVREALEPFAHQAASYDEPNPITGQQYPDSDPAPECFSVGDYRRARGALEETKG